MKPYPKLPQSACVAAVVVAMMLLAPLARAQVLQQVPADALVVVKFNKLKPVSDKIAALMQKLGVAAMKPEMNDPLGTLQKEAGVTQGIDPAGEAAFVVLNGDFNSDKPPFVLMLPVTDYKAFVGNFADAKTEGDISTVHPKNDPQDTYLANWGKYAVLSPSKELLNRKPEGITASGLAAKELESKDIVAYVNMKTARAKILPAITQGRTKFMAEMEKGMQGGGGMRRSPARPPGAAAGANAAAANAEQQKFMPLMRTVVNRFIDIAEQVVRDADSATYGISLTDAGINGTLMAEFAAGSPSATRVMTLKNSDASMLAGLPQIKYLMFGGSQDQAKAIGQQVSDFMAPIEKEFAALGVEGQTMQKWADAVKSYMGAATASSFGAATPSGMIGQDAIIQPMGVLTGDSKQILDAQKQMFDSQQAATDMIMQLTGAPANARPQMKMTYTANAKTVDGVTLNQMSTNFGAQPGQPMNAQQAQMQQMMTFMYGPGGLNAVAGAVDDKKVVTAAGANDQMLSKLIAAAKSGSDTLAQTPGVTATARQLPPTRVAAFYVALDQIATTAANYAKAFGMPINFQVPADLAPIGFTFGTDGNALRGDWHVPSQTLQSLVAAGMQTYMQMQGGQPPGGPGGL
jgi:hypothetical protein